MNILFAITALFGLFTNPVMNEVQNTETPIVEEIEEKTVYSYTDEAGEYTYTIESETQVLVKAVSNSGTYIDALCTYTIEENVLRVYFEENEIGVFVIGENNVLTLYEEPPVEEVPPIITDEENNKYNENILQLIQELEEELKKDSKDMEVVAKILLGIIAAVGSILLTLAVKLIKLKIKNIDKDALYKAAEAKAYEKFEEYQNQVNLQLQSLETKVCRKIDETEEQRQKEAEARSIKLRESVEEAKKNLDIKKVLND